MEIKKLPSDMVLGAGFAVGVSTLAKETATGGTSQHLGGPPIFAAPLPRPPLVANACQSAEGTKTPPSMDIPVEDTADEEEDPYGQHFGGFAGTTALKSQN